MNFSPLTFHPSLFSEEHCVRRGTTLKHRTDDKLVLERKMVTHHDVLTWDLKRCVGCHIGPLVCPKDALSHVPAVVEEGCLIKMASVDVDPETCVFCGMCTVTCPTTAITLTLNGESSIPVQRFEAFPELLNAITFDGEVFDWSRRDFVIENCPTDVIRYDEEQETLVVDEEHCIYCRQCEIASDGAFQVEQAWQGSVELRREKCVEGCYACADICPTRALYIDDDSGELLLADYYCIKCGACMEVCPIKPETEEYEVTFESHGITHTRTRERVTNVAELPIWVERWRISHTEVQSGAWVAALVRLADDKAGMMELGRKRALKRRDLLLALKGGRDLG